MNLDPRLLLSTLERLRWSLVRIAIILICGLALGYFTAPSALTALLKQGGGLEGLVFLSPGEAFFARLKLALAIGALVTLPLLLQQLVGVFAPMLPRPDRKTLYIALPFVYLLFIGGVAFAYLGVLPLALRFFLSFAGENLQPVISVGNFIAFAIMFALPFGLVFQLPVLIVILARLGLVKAEWLAKRRKYAILVIFVLAAVVTPADVFSQITMAVPMLILFEISLVLARISGRRRAAQQAAREAARADEADGQVGQSAEIEGRAGM